ncbi:hypothetical protein D3C76_1446760 [compost metagenome]
MEDMLARYAPKPALALVPAQEAEMVEPVAWQYMTHPTWDKGAWPSEWTDCTKEAHADYVRAPLIADWEYRTRKLYTSPPAPVSVVLPERLKVDYMKDLADRRSPDWYRGWNACLDKVKELNH